MKETNENNFESNSISKLTEHHSFTGHTDKINKIDIYE